MATWCKFRFFSCFVIFSAANTKKVIAFSIPLVSFFIGSALSPHKRYYFVLLHVSILAFAISVLVNGFVTNFLKVWIGRPRPDFLARCQPRDGTNVDGLVTVEVCTTSDQSKLEDGFKSLPSGHASISFSSFYFLSLWMAGQLNVFSPDAVNGTNGTSVKALICFYPILLAAFVAISRTEDYRHRGSDIIAGTLIGTVIAWISYRMFFPPLAAPDCDTPYVLRQVLFEEAESQEYQSSGETPRFESTGYEPSVFENASYERTRPRPPQQPQEPPIQERELTEFDISNRV